MTGIDEIVLSLTAKGLTGCGTPRRSPAPRKWTPNAVSDERRLIDRDEWTPPAARSAATKVRRITVGEYAQTWLAQRTLKHRTRAYYAALLANHITTSTLGGVPLKSLTPQASLPNAIYRGCRDGEGDGAYEALPSRYYQVRTQQ